MPEKLYRIGEAATLLDLKTYVLRFWESEFPQLQPVRTAKGQRLYTEETIALLRRIRYLLHEKGMPPPAPLTQPRRTGIRTSHGAWIRNCGGFAASCWKNNTRGGVCPHGAVPQSCRKRPSLSAARPSPGHATPEDICHDPLSLPAFRRFLATG